MEDMAGSNQVGHWQRLAWLGAQTGLVGRWLVRILGTGEYQGWEILFPAREC